MAIPRIYKIEIKVGGPVKFTQGNQEWVAECAIRKLISSIVNLEVLSITEVAIRTGTEKPCDQFLEDIHNEFPQTRPEGECSR